VIYERLPDASLNFQVGERCPERFDKPSPPGAPVRRIEIVQ